MALKQKIFKKKNITDERGYELFNSDNTAQNKTRYICMINLNIWYSFIKFTNLKCFHFVDQILFTFTTVL